MAIPETQLETWCNPGALATSAQAYGSIKSALAHQNAGLTYPNPEIYLQGSYGNSTHIYAESDVDIVVQHNASWGRDLSVLSQVEQQRYNGHFVTATYGNPQLRSDVLRALQRYFGSGAVTSGPKAIKVKTPNGRTVDVIPALEYRKYHSFQSPQIQSYTSGIKFEDSSGRTIINFPKQHMKNGELKNSKNRTDGRYKQAIRMFKNMRTHMVDHGSLADGGAPSYFIECLLYNVPDALFVPSRRQTFENIWNYLSNTIPTDRAVCQNEQTLLFGNSSEQWTTAAAATFLQGLRTLWETW